jgi:hypothetical protein
MSAPISHPPVLPNPHPALSRKRERVPRKWLSCKRKRVPRGVSRHGAGSCIIGGDG